MPKQKISYDPNAVEITLLPIKGSCMERVHGQTYIVQPRLYSVSDKNLKTRGSWVAQVHEKRKVDQNGVTHESLVISIFLAPSNASHRMISLTRSSIMVQQAAVGRYAGKPYIHVTFRDPEGFGGKRTAGRGERTELPDWFMAHYSNRLRLRKTVQGAVQSDSEVGQRLATFHDIKQVVVFPYWDDEQFIRLFFLMRVFSVEQGYEL